MDKYNQLFLKARFVLILLFAFSTASTKAQELEILKYTLGSSGDIYQVENLSISHTIGQPSLIGHFSSGSLHLLQGFQHPLVQYKTEEKETFKLLSVYPNPSTGDINLSWNGHDIEDKVEVSLINLEGKTVITEQYMPIDNHLKIDYALVPRGFYYIKVLHKKGGLGNASIILL